MKVLLNEKQMNKLILWEMFSESETIGDGSADHNPYHKQIETFDHIMDSFLSNNGMRMVNIENNREYLVYELDAFFQLVGRRFGMCRLMKDGEPYGATYIKPMVLFKIKTNC